jgi:hypothetical protein
MASLVDNGHLTIAGSILEAGGGFEFPLRISELKSLSQAQA